MLRWLSYELTFTEDGSLPVIVSAAKLRQLSDVTLSALCELAEPQLNPTLITGNQKLYLLLDGLDELVGAESGGEALACDLLRKLCGAVPPSTRVLAACRSPAYPALADDLTSTLPHCKDWTGRGDIYDFAIARALKFAALPPFIIQLAPIQHADAEAYLRNRLPHAVLDATLHERTIRPFLTSPFSVRLLSLALPYVSRLGTVSLVDLYRVFINAALMREKPSASQREIESIISSLRDLGAEPNRQMNPDHARVARAAGLITQKGWQTEFSHYTLWEYLYSDTVHRQIVNWDSQLLSRLDLVSGYYLNRFLVPMMLANLATFEHRTARLRVVSTEEYRDFLKHRQWRTLTGYGIHPSITSADDGTPSATFPIRQTDARSINEDSNHGTRIASGISWYDASVFALHAGSLMPTSDQLRSIQVEGDYVFWGSEWYDEEMAHVSAFDVKADKIVGINPDVRLPRTALAVVD